MKPNACRILGIGAALTLAISTHLYAAEIQVPFAETAELSLDLDLGEPAEWKLESSGPDEARYSCQGHALVLRLQEQGQGRLVRMTLTPPAGRKLSVRSYTANMTMAQAGLHAVMVPNTRPIAHSLIYFHEHRTWPKDMRIYRCLIPAGFEEGARANSEEPFILLTDKSGNNRLSVGWTAADRATSLKGAARGEQYVLTLSRQDDVPFAGQVLEDSLYISTRSGPWLEVATDYAEAFDAANGRKHEAAPEWATDPVFCTWYCYQDHIDQAGVLKIARKCREMGFGTILIDAGWDCRPDGGYGDWEHGILGDFMAAPDRFPDLPGAIREMHEMGLKVELWSAPFWQGRQSKAYKERTRDFHAWTKEGEDRNLCPRCVGVREHLKDVFAKVAERYAMDGMWLDAADGVPPECVARHQHVEQSMGVAFVDCLAAIHDGLRSVNPQAVTEARVLHANIHSKRALDVVQPSDAPESFEVLRLAGIQMRPWAYDIVLKNDPMFWKKDADAATVGKFLATMVCNGVPALSVDFLTASDWQCRQTAAWLKFYKEHKQTLLCGEFRLFGADAGAPDMMLLGKGEAVVYMRNVHTRDMALPREVDRVILLNCTDADGLKLTLTPGGKPEVVRIFGPDWTRIEAAASGENSEFPSLYRVPQGGAAIIEVTSEPKPATRSIQFAINDAQGQPVPCRIHLVGQSGTPIRAPGQPFWHDHFVCSGRVVIPVGPGQYRYEIEHGPEYRRLNGTIEVTTSRDETVTLELTRLADLAREGWYSGDLHVHRPVEVMPLLMRAEDLHVAPVITWWNQTNPWKDHDPPARLLESVDGNRFYHLMAGEDERGGGALLFFHLDRPLEITKAFREHPSAMKFVNQARKRDPRVWIDIEKPFWWDVPIWLASGQADSIGIANNHMCRSQMLANEAWGRPRDTKHLPDPLGNGYWSQEIYYQILNCGIRVPPSAGSASGVLPNPVGYDRVYVHLGGPMDYAKWWEGLKAGRSFVTNGPLLLCKADGKFPGHVFKGEAGQALNLNLELKLITSDRVPRIEIIKDGLMDSYLDMPDSSSHEASARVRFTESGWFLIRAVADNPRTFRFASTAPFYVELGQQPRRISRKSVQFFLDWLGERERQLRSGLNDAVQLREVLSFHEEAMDYWRHLASQANAD